MNTQQQISLEPATHEHEATRTLVKSPPELWAECSEAASLARHLGEFGEIKITRLEPETAVAWEGERASGTVRIEPSAWGTRVTLTAQTKAETVEAGENGPAQLEAAQNGPAQLEAAQNGAAEVPAEPPAEVQPPEPDEEESDAQVEEALEEPDPPLAAEPGVAGARRRRLIERIRWLFTAERDAETAPTEPLDDPEPEPVAESEPQLQPEVAPDDEPESDPAETHGEPAPSAEPGLDAEAVLATALDSLGQAHHRPFSRA